MLRSYFFVLALLAFSVVARAQSTAGFGFEYRPAAKVMEGADTLRNAWAGGFNSPQFSSIDLNNDGQADLFAFDHETARVYTFLNVAAPGTTAGRRWQYAPEYESLFPSDLEQWVLLRDYDCDGRPDLFTYINGGEIRVLRNVLVNGLPNFQLATNQIRFSGSFSGTANLTIGGYNLPAIQDFNGDGKLDIMTYDFITAQFIEQYINTSPGTCGGALTFTMTTDNWGGIQSCGTCAGFLFNGQSCFSARTLHTGGHSLLLVDLDGDGDQDLLDGRDNCPELTRILNQGTVAVPVVTQAGISASFPSAATPVHVPVFPTGYSIDADFDGRLDLVVAPNMVDNRLDHASLSHQVQLFTNSAAAGAAPVYTLRTGGLLQSEMLDVSEGAAPAVGDLSGDGLPDLLVGNYADLVGGHYRSALAYYRNVGTRTRPVLQLVTADYLGLAARQLRGLKPALVDLNRDGALDLVFPTNNDSIDATNFLYYVLNTAPAGQPAAFNIANINYFKSAGAVGSGRLPYHKGVVPCFTDVDGDGYVDLLIGTNEVDEPGMSLRYFRNRARGPVDSMFVLANDDFGQIRTATGTRPDNLAPTVADFDGDGRPDLVTVDASGQVRFVSDFRAQGALFSTRTDVLYNPARNIYENTQLGVGLVAHYGLAVSDYDGDGAPELLVGTQAGGIRSFATRNRGLATATHPTTAAASTLALAIYPNPATAAATVETAQPTRLSVLDLSGRLVQSVTTAQRRYTLDLNGLAPGVYLVRAEGTDGATAVQRLLVR